MFWFSQYISAWWQLKDETFVMICTLYGYIALLACWWRHVLWVPRPLWDAKEIRIWNLRLLQVYYVCQKYSFRLSFIAGAASQAGDADSFRAPGLTSGLQGSVNVHRGALLLVPQWRCISSFVFYIKVSDVHKWGYPSKIEQCNDWNLLFLIYLCLCIWVYVL